MLRALSTSSRNGRQSTQAAPAAPRRTVTPTRPDAARLIADTLKTTPRQTREGEAPAPTPATNGPAPANREFRGAWMATVANIDWPSKQGLSVAEMKAELTAMLDKARETGLNAVVFQVRPAGDALYNSPFEPWSEYLTGKQGQAPADGFDPLAFAVEEAHNRGIELHAWINPFRARMLKADGQPYTPAAPNHVSRTHPEWVKTYGNNQWLDPGEQGVQDLAIAVARDIVKRYNVDGIQIDDYFYPYPQKKNGQNVPFPDDASWKKYQAAGGKLNRDDWRRNNVDRFVERLYKEVHEARPTAQVGISPFGIWKPGHPSGITGMDPTQELYADAKLWLQNGWLDYLAPQLYWPIDKPAQSFPRLLEWWQSVNTKGRNLFAGLFTSKVADGTSSAWTAEAITRQVDVTRGQDGANGHIHFSAKPLLTNRGGLVDKLAPKYREAALPPATPWLDVDGKPPAAPNVAEATRTRTGGHTLTWASPEGAEAVKNWLVYTRKGDKWSMDVLGANKQFVAVGPDVDAVAIAAVDLAGTEGPRTELKLK